MAPHPLSNFEIQKYYQNEPKFNGVYSWNNLPKIKDGAYIVNFDGFKSIEFIGQLYMWMVITQYILELL